MINFLIALVFQTSPAVIPIDWATQLFESKPAKTVLSSAHPTGRPEATSSWREVRDSKALQQHDGSPTFIGEDFDLAMDAIHHATDLLGSGKSDEAYSSISSFRKRNPNLNDFVEPTIADCALLSGRYEEAFKECVVYISTHTGPRSWVGEGDYLRLSLAAAGCGHVFAGQDDYCINWFQRKCSESWRDAKPLNLTQGQVTPREVMIHSMLVLAVTTWATQEYLEAVLNLDPTNEIAGHMLVQYDSWQGRYADLRRIGALMAQHVTDPESRAFYLAQISAVSGLADRPKSRKAPTSP